MICPAIDRFAFFPTLDIPVTPLSLPSLMSFKTTFLLFAEWEGKSGTACRVVIMIALYAGLPTCEAVNITTFGTCPHVFDTLRRHDGKVLSGR